METTLLMKDRPRAEFLLSYKKTARDFLAMIVIVAIALGQVTKCIGWT